MPPGQFSPLLTGGRGDYGGGGSLGSSGSEEAVGTYWSLDGNTAFQAQSFAACKTVTYPKCVRSHFSCGME